MVLVDCRACGHIWKSRQYKGNALLGEWLFLIALRHSTKLTSAGHVTSRHVEVRHFKRVCATACKVFCDVVRAREKVWAPFLLCTEFDN